MSQPYSARHDPISEARRHWEEHGWEDAASGMAAVTTIVRAGQILVTRIEEFLAPLGLTFSRFEILRLLGFTRSGQMPMGKIGERLQIHPASVTSAVKRLERDGLIARQTESTDNRIVLAALTGAGRATVAEATVLVNQVFSSLPLTDRELEELTRLLGVFRADAGDVVE